MDPASHRQIMRNLRSAVFFVRVATVLECIVAVLLLFKLAHRVGMF